MFAILNISILLLIMHYFAVRQLVLYTSYYWYERNLLLSALTNLSLSMYLFNNDLIRYLSTDDFLGVMVLAFCLPVVIFHFYYSFMKQYYIIYKNGFEKTVHNNMFAF